MIEIFFHLPFHEKHHILHSLLTRDRSWGKLVRGDECFGGQWAWNRNGSPPLSSCQKATIQATIIDQKKRQGRPPRCFSTTPTSSKSFFQMVTSSSEKDSNSQTKSKKKRISHSSSQDETHSPFEVLDKDSFSQASFSAIISSIISYAEMNKK